MTACKFPKYDDDGVADVCWWPAVDVGRFPEYCLSHALAAEALADRIRESCEKQGIPVTPRAQR